MSLLRYRRGKQDLRCRATRSARLRLFAAASVCAAGAAVPAASAETLPVPPYHTQGAYRVECQQDQELVLVIEPAYRAWVDRGRIRGWQFVTADGIPIQGRIGTNVNCRYDLLPANAYPLTAFVNPDAGPAPGAGAGISDDSAEPAALRSAPAIEVAPLAPPTLEIAAVPETIDPAPDPFVVNPPAAGAVEVTSVAPTIILPPITRPAISQPPATEPPSTPPIAPATGDVGGAEPTVETPPVDSLPTAPPGSGAYWVQLGAFGTVAEGHLAWAQLLNAAGWSDLAALQPVMQRVAPAPGRVLHRLRVDVRTAERARALCALQQAAGGECLMVGPGMTPDAWVAEIAQPADGTDAPANPPPSTGSPVSASQAAPNWSLP